MKKLQSFGFLLPILLAACLGPSGNMYPPESSTANPLQVTVFKSRF